jgi:3-hydroxyacyl-[acyl-carrier-protein] dehydratase
LSGPPGLDRVLAGRPQPAPYAMLDGVSEQSGDALSGWRDVRQGEAWAAGHFPGDPILPGVLQLEGMLQAALLLLGEDASLVGLDGVRFRRVVRPGDRLELHVQIRQRTEHGWQIGGSARVGEEPAAEARLRFVRSPNA